MTSTSPEANRPISAERAGGPPFFWNRYTDGEGGWLRGDEPPPGEQLAALRRGLGREAGTVPEMWRYYIRLTRDGSLSDGLAAEHAALSLYALHQQSQRAPMHRAGIGVGTAVRALHESGRFGEEAVRRRFGAAASATDSDELVMHLRSLIGQLCVIRQPLDYTTLVGDLKAWNSHDQRGWVRRRWAGGFFPAESREAADLPAQP